MDLIQTTVLRDFVKLLTRFDKVSQKAKAYTLRTVKTQPPAKFDMAGNLNYVST